MSEYQYYDFRAVDRPLGKDVRETLRSISSRGRITEKRFSNEYHFGSFKGDPCAWMEQWFDLHLHFTNWGTRRLMLRVPEKFVPLASIERILEDGDVGEAWVADGNLIIDIAQEQDEAGGTWYGDPDDDDADWLTAIEPVRAELLAGDLRLFYIIWLMSVADGALADDAVEPMPGLGPLSDALGAMSDFFEIDADLVEAAAETGEGPMTISANLSDVLAAIPDVKKVALLLRVAEGDPLVAAELRSRARVEPPSPSAPLRTAGALRARVRELEEARAKAEAERQEAEQRRQAEAHERARRERIDVLRKLDEGAWRLVEDDIMRRNAPGYDRAAAMLADLEALAAEDGWLPSFSGRIAAIRSRHSGKGKFIERIVGLGRG